MRFPPVIAALLLSLAAALCHGEERGETFEEWLEGLRVEARGLGLSEAAIAALDEVEAPIERVLELDGGQPEFVQRFSRYLGLRVTPAQVERGRQLLARHAGLLAEVRDRYGVQPHYLVSLWAIESNYGRNTGGFKVLQALATLAYDPRRAAFFRRELLTALRIIHEGHIAPARMSGSWAGAMGQLQFLPSVFYEYGVDGDGDGRIDIWGSLPDVFHSAANYLQHSGWRAGQRWGREVLLPEGFDYRLADRRSLRTPDAWARLGLRRSDGGALPSAAGMEAALVLPAGAAGPAFLAYDNYRATLGYNPSTFYALTVGHLADRLSGGAALVRMPARERSFSIAEVRRLQRLLTAAGHDPGRVDGRAGRRTRAAIRDYQEAQGLPADGYASKALLERITASSTPEALAEADAAEAAEAVEIIVEN